MVERPTKQPGATLTRVPVPDAVRDLSATVSFQCRLSYDIRIAFVCNRMRQHFVRTLKIPNTCSPAITGADEKDATQTDTNWLAALVAAVA